MKDDVALLQNYVDDGSEKAFAELVHRHFGLVYHAALRQTGGTDTAPRTSPNWCFPISPARRPR